jgi:hypothetical protein
MQEFTASTEQLARWDFVGFPVDYIQKEAVYAFVDGFRDREVKQNLLIGGERRLNETLNQAIRLEAAKAAAWPPARLRQVTRIPTWTPLTIPERRRYERPVSRCCGESGHFRRY